jgi:hypothetical protein
MNDYHLDPPEEPEPPDCPECEDGYASDYEKTADGQFLYVCECCGAKWECDDCELYEPDPPEWKCEDCGQKYPCDCCEEPEEETECVHGNEPGYCDHCDYLGDLAYDAAREGRR